MSARAVAEWENRVRAEYSSAALAARVVQGLIATGMPRPLIDTSLRIVADELDHAKLSADVWSHLGGVGVPAIELRQLEAPAGPVLQRLVEDVVQAFCIGETLAVPLFAAMLAGTAEPVVRPVIERILRDEAVHRSFGWEALTALLDVDPVGIRAHVQHRVRGWIEVARSAYVVPGEAWQLSATERNVGLLDLPDYANIVEGCMRDTLIPRFARLGLF